MRYAKIYIYVYKLVTRISAKLDGLKGTSKYLIENSLI